MDTGNSQYTNEPFSTRVIHVIQSIWPSVYRTIDGVVFGTLHFVIDTLSGLWRR